MYSIFLTVSAYSSPNVASWVWGKLAGAGHHLSCSTIQVTASLHLQLAGTVSLLHAIRLDTKTRQAATLHLPLSVWKVLKSHILYHLCCVHSYTISYRHLNYSTS